MVWDSTGKSWAALGVPSQPAWILLDKDGVVKSGDSGEIPYEDILKQI
jgi:hypothetical protein